MWCVVVVRGAVGTALAFSLFGAARASAMMEICPAAAHLITVAAPGTSQQAAIVLDAASARTVRGEIEIATDGGFFRVPFPAVDLKAPAVPKRDWDAATSPALAFVFPAPTRVKSVWIRNATLTAGNPAWIAAGTVDCLPMSRESGTGSSAPPTDDRRPVEVAAIAAPNLERTDCAVPFAGASVVNAVQPRYPYLMQMPKATSLIEILIAPSGKAIDATVFRSSGFDAYDIAARTAAKASQYAPAVKYCRPIFGTYVFRADFD